MVYASLWTQRTTPGPAGTDVVLREHTQNAMTQEIVTWSVCICIFVWTIFLPLGFVTGNGLSFVWCPDKWTEGWSAEYFAAKWKKQKWKITGVKAHQLANPGLPPFLEKLEFSEQAFQAWTFPWCSCKFQLCLGIKWSLNYENQDFPHLTEVVLYLLILATFLKYSILCA